MSGISTTDVGVVRCAHAAPVAGRIIELERCFGHASLIDTDVGLTTEDKGAGLHESLLNMLGALAVKAHTSTRP